MPREKVIMGQQAGFQTKHSNLGPSLFPRRQKSKIEAVLLSFENNQTFPNKRFVRDFTNLGR